MNIFLEFCKMGHFQTQYSLKLKLTSCKSVEIIQTQPAHKFTIKIRIHFKGRQKPVKTKKIKLV